MREFIRLLPKVYICILRGYLSAKGLESKSCILASKCSVGSVIVLSPKPMLQTT